VLTGKQTFAIDTVVYSNISTRPFLAYKAKDAVGDYFRKNRHVHRCASHPDIPLHIHALTPNAR
jgi:23S rRNA G2445 N2-methylase RlmL